MTQVGPLRECQDIMGPASACLFIIWSPSGGSFRLPVCLVMHCKMPSLWWSASVPFLFYSNFPALSVRKISFSLLCTVLRSAEICGFSGSAAALVTLSISLAFLNQVSLCYFQPGSCGPAACPAGACALQVLCVPQHVSLIW
jgi:hypothetical protein